MTKQKRTYAPEFKQEAIQLWQSSGKSATLGLARDRFCKRRRSKIASRFSAKSSVKPANFAHLTPQTAKSRPKTLDILYKHLYNCIDETITICWF